MRSNFTALSVTFSLALLAAVVGCNQSAPTTTSDDSSQPANSTTVAVNTHCPIMGGKVSQEARTVEWNGKTIGFCCDGCDEKFMALSDDDKSEKLAAAQAKSEGNTGHEGHQNDDHDHS